ncbi:MAG: hypothetical protein NDI61_14595 [Bdellovibrionaceae bacterium]|nr:hypothetical protein [Pseudobdellovibrionaceae bacterium]
MKYVTRLSWNAASNVAGSLARNLFSSLGFLCIILSACPSAAQDSDGGGGGSFYEKYKRRQSQRFDLIGYLSDQKRIRAEQDAKWGYVKDGLPFEPDLTLSYFQLGGDLERGTKLGEVTEKGGRAQFFMNGLLSSNNKRRAINIDLGFEGYYRSSTFTASAGSVQTDWASTETGGAILLRPFGRSSQDTSLFFKAGYGTFDTKGLFSASDAAKSLASGYWGGEAKLYLLPFLGARAEYASTFEKEDIAWAAKWKQTRLTYGAFFELFVISFEAQIFETTYQLTPTGGGTPTQDTQKGMGLLGTLHF